MFTQLLRSNHVRGTALLLQISNCKDLWGDFHMTRISWALRPHGWEAPHPELTAARTNAHAWFRVERLWAVGGVISGYAHFQKGKPTSSCY